MHITFHILQSTANPMRLQDIAIVTSTPLDTDMVLLEKFKSHDRVQYDPKTGLYSYRVRALTCYGTRSFRSS